MSKYLYYKLKYLKYKTKRGNSGNSSNSYNSGVSNKKSKVTDPVSNLSKTFESVAENLEPETLETKVVSTSNKKSIGLADIKKLFTTSDLASQIDEIKDRQMYPTKKQLTQESFQVRKSSRLEEKALLSTPAPKRNSDYIYNYNTPMLFTPGTLALLESPLGKDNKAIQKIIEEEELDPDYVAYDANYGKIVETWFADTYKCPCCGTANSLRRYSSDIFPVIDLVCINPEHKVQIHGVRYFQVKASNGTLFAGDTYFDLTSNSKHIYTGSKRFGEPVHAITAASSPDDKEFLIGYICVLIQDFEPDDDTITNINVQSIGYVLPHVNNTSGLYYTYTQSIRSKPKITWESVNMKVEVLSLEFRSLIPRDYLSRHFYEVSSNPLSKNQ